MEPDDWSSGDVCWVLAVSAFLGRGGLALVNLRLHDRKYLK